MPNYTYDEKFTEKIYKKIKNGMTIEELSNMLKISINEAWGLVELCNLYRKTIHIRCDENDEYILNKPKKPRKTNDVNKPDLSDLELTKLCVVSDTHFGSIHQQLHLLNNVYQEAHNRDIDTVLHCGDVVDGNYTSIRKEQTRELFLTTFDEQVGYVVDMYPEVKGIKTYYILGSHDETHYKNGGATLEYWISKCRKDMIFLGQNSGDITINNIRISLDHPGGGSAKSLSYAPQNRIEALTPGKKPHLLLIGHYHKNYCFSYRNVEAVLVPALCDKTQFQQKKGLVNSVGAYFLNIYSNEKGNIEFFEPEEMLFDYNDFWDESKKDFNKVKKLKI